MAPIAFKGLENGLGGRKGVDFGTVRPRVQIPGPRPKIVFRIAALLAPPTPPCHTGGHRFSRKWRLQPTFKWIGTVD
jgi:hypothetical protein